MNIVKFLVKTLTCDDESKLDSKLGASLPLVPSSGEHAAPLKNKLLVDVEGRTPLRDCEEKEFSWGLGTPESSANWVPSRRQLAPVLVRSRGKVCRKRPHNAGGKARESGVAVVNVPASSHHPCTNSLAHRRSGGIRPVHARCSGCPRE